MNSPFLLLRLYLVLYTSAVPIVFSALPFPQSATFVRPPPHQTVIEMRENQGNISTSQITGTVSWKREDSTSCRLLAINNGHHTAAAIVVLQNTAFRRALWEILF